VDFGSLEENASEQGIQTGGAIIRAALLLSAYFR
jgi:hypothetical protein